MVLADNYFNRMSLNSVNVDGFLGKHTLHSKCHCSGSQSGKLLTNFLLIGLTYELSKIGRQREGCSREGGLSMTDEHVVWCFKTWW